MVTLLIVLCALFVARVVGQILVVLWHPRWLPPMDAWMSGVMPYRYLLPSQLAIIALQIFMIVQVIEGAPANRTLIIAIYIFATLYALAMVVRFFVKRYPLIPIIFHWVLAAFLFTYAAARGAS
ncbi:MAG TPA: hypothetical protein VHK90_00265 [Thermoanaerobaculia bacterium]|nr:hypothetical protein [Thermoanaerobaculia bacterium]